MLAIFQRYCMTEISIIGAGKFAFSFCAALRQAGYFIKSVISRNINSAAELAQLAGAGIHSDKLSDLPSDSSVIFITVPDSEIENTALRLSALERNFKDNIIVHCSGALDSTLLEPLAVKGALTASFHIMQTFPSKEAVDIKGCHVSLETNFRSASDFLMRMTEALQLKAFALTGEQKIAYHLAGVFACNFLASNLFSAGELFSGPVDSYTLVEPIIYSTLNNIKKYGAADAISGPVDRGDVETIKRHLSVINSKELLNSYIAQSQMLLLAAEKKYSHLNGNQKLIRQLLDEAMQKLL